jgi:hypothetical protein
MNGDMMQFKIWLNEEQGYDFFKNILFGKLNLDRDHGLSQEVDTWEPDNLINMLNGLGEFKKLPQQVQDQAIGQIRSRMGTLGDLIQIMASSSRDLESD